ncbi:MAG: hypothetical protein WCX84_04750 [Syntrophales bacterium]|jgi:hypothetical protein|nr:hypothetical protein [Deltaproteobacteria bacterium]
MKSVRFEVKNYQITMGPDLASIESGRDVKVCAIIGCYGNEYKLMINFVSENEGQPKAIYDAEKKTGAIYVPISRMSQYVDMLRNEKPIYAQLNDRVEWITLGTGHEPIGEGERK